MQAPDPLQESVPSQSPPFEVPTQEVVLGWNPLSLHTPARQVSWFVQEVPASPQKVPSAFGAPVEQMPVDVLHVPTSWH